jgi:hypothetical protein
LVADRVKPYVISSLNFDDFWSGVYDGNFYVSTNELAFDAPDVKPLV